MIFEKIKNKNNFPIILFFIILINYIPLILPNMISKSSYGVGTIPMVLCFGIEIILLIIFFYKKIEITEEIKKNVIILSVISLILFIVQIKNYILKEYQIMDFANIICQFIDILLLFICVINFKINEEKISIFMKAIMYMGVCACFVNMILYFKEILQMFGIIKGGYIADMKSFFANRNQFAFFLYVAMIANIYVLFNENILKNKCILGLFILNLIFTMSRTGISVAGIFIFIYFLTIDKISKENKIKLLTIALIFRYYKFTNNKLD